MQWDWIIALFGLSLCAQAGAGRAVTQPAQRQGQDKEDGGRGQVAVWSAGGVALSFDCHAVYSVGLTMSDSGFVLSNSYRLTPNQAALRPRRAQDR
jgi:hypothetical protein